MAVRSGAGTGVLVSLIVFVIATVALLALTIIFYAGKTDEADRAAEATDALEVYVKPAERNREDIKAIEQAASSSRVSVTQYLNQRLSNVMAFAGGNPNMSIEELKATMNARFGVQEGGSMLGAMESLQRQVSSQESELEGLRTRLADRDDQISDLRDQIAQMKRDQEQELAQVSSEIVTYRQAADRYREDVQSTIQSLDQASDRLRREYEGRIDDLEDELDVRGAETVLLRSRLEEYEEILNKIRIKSRNPAMLVDGNVIDVDPANERVFIDRGRQQRIVLGMTFEVYDDAASIRVDDATGRMPRGKASIQVVKVGETTSTCKIIRSVPGRPVVRNDVIANAVYDPDYRFRFLVHGKFDVDQDGRPTEQEAEFLRSLVVDWGGEIVLGDELPGDLDFLVLGQMPPQPSPLRANATPREIEVWAEQREAREQYLRLFDNASEAQIPVLNANRFFILIGRATR